MQKLDGVHCKGQAEEVVGNPVLLQQIPGTHNQTADQTDDVIRRKLVIDYILDRIAGAFSEMYMIMNVGHSSWN